VPVGIYLWHGFTSRCLLVFLDLKMQLNMLANTALYLVAFSVTFFKVQKCERIWENVLIRNWFLSINKYNCACFGLNWL